MSILLEKSWKLNLAWGEKAIINALKHLTNCANTSLVNLFYFTHDLMSKKLKIICYDDNPIISSIM